MRTLLIVGLLCCLAFGWLARQLQTARERQSIVAQLDQIGVYVYQYEPTALGRLTRTSPSFDSWIRTTFGDSLLSTASAVSAHRIADHQAEPLIRQLHQLPGLRTLHLGPVIKETEDRLRTALPGVDVEMVPGFGV